MPGTTEFRALVHNLLVIHHVEDDPNKQDGLILDGTMQQFVILPSGSLTYFDLDDDKPFRFEYRFNDQREDKAKLDEIDEPQEVQQQLEEEQASSQKAYQHFFRLNEVPLEVDVELDAFPFKLVSATLKIDLIPFKSSDGKARYRPSLMVHRKDKRNMFLFKMEKFRKPDMFPRLMSGNSANQNTDHKLIQNLDRSFVYDFVSPFPKVAYYYDAKKRYCPTYSVSFLLAESGLRKFIEIVLPMVLIATMNFLNVMNEVRAAQKQEQGDEDYEPVPATDYLGISATLALAVVVFLPTMISRTQVQALFTVNNFYIVAVFVSLTLSSLPHSLVGTSTPGIFGAYLFWASFMFPISNGLRYLRFKRNWRPKGEFFDRNMIPAFKRSKPENLVEEFMNVEDVIQMSDECRHKMDYKVKVDSGKSRILEFCDDLDKVVSVSG